ncbi:MAG: adenylyl-sulfate kinase, partial [Caldilineaceae bacterium]
HIEAILCWLAEEPLDLRTAYILRHTTSQTTSHVSQIDYRINVDTLRHEKTPSLAMNDIARVQIETAQPLFVDPYARNRATGALILIDPRTHNTVAAGLVQAAHPSKPVAQAERTANTVESRSRNVHWDGVAIERTARERRNGHAAAVLWFTGLPSAGKSTVAGHLERLLFAIGVQTVRLDGDNLRHGLNADLGFSEADRSENIRRVAEVARIAFDHGAVVLCTFVSPYRTDRDRARSLLPSGRFLEIWVHCDVAECRRRDPKGLYARADRGEIADFTGVSTPYEPPQAAEILLDTNVESADRCAGRIVDALRLRGLIPPFASQPVADEPRQTLD